MSNFYMMIASFVLGVTIIWIAYLASDWLLSRGKSPRKILLILPRYTNSGKLKWFKRVYMYHHPASAFFFPEYSGPIVEFVDEYKDIPEKYRNEP